MKIKFVLINFFAMMLFSSNKKEEEQWQKMQALM